MKKIYPETFSSAEEINLFLLNYYVPALRQISKSDLGHILCIQATGRYDDGRAGSYVINAIRNNWKNIPPLPFDIILYRGDCNRKKIYLEYGRPYLSASFEWKVAKRFSGNHNPHKIIAKKGSILIPTSAVEYIHENKCHMSTGESEVIIDTSRLHRHINVYVYK